MNNPVSAQTLQEMKTYYRERAREYDEWFYRQGRYNHGPEASARWFAATLPEATCCRVVDGVPRCALSAHVGW